MDNTSQKIDTLISGFKSVVRHLLDQGFDVNRAIEEAYKRYPVIDGMKESIVDDMIKSFISGYMNASVEVGVDTRDIPYSSEAISTAMQRAWSKDNLNLSTRLHKRGQAVRKEVADILKATIGKGNTNKKIASELLNRGVIDTAELPKFMKEVAQIPISMSADKKRKLLRNVHRQVSKRTTAGIRAAYNEVINAVNNDNQEKLDKAIEIATEEKTRYNAERIARTEIARAYADGQVSRCIDDDDIVAFQWKLGSRHPVFDICDFYANADLYGMGKGVFPKDKVPLLPVHPNCMCHLKPIVKGSLKNEVPKERIEEGGREYLDGITNHKRERLFGVHGAKAVEEGTSWTQKARGYSGKVLESRLPKIDVNVIMNSEVATDKRLAISKFEFIPLGTIVKPKRIIAGLGSDKDLRTSVRLGEKYNTNAIGWSKLVGIIPSNKYIFDIYWYYHKDTGPIEFKIKSKKERRK
ncbi:hypothetical protein [Veillonella montpellierensis]|uniref:hypothetical protein n=1 Tax=Veillonella montpellierensis TaxID=187328 RepID=UPI0023F66004|nr:hypothetical protein [Veillonella montpellierensis]